MSIQMKNGCLVYYGSLIGYQAKDQAEVTVDPQFRREELESWLTRHGLVPRWEEGVYERLANEGFHARDSAPELQSCRIWQLKPGMKRLAMMHIEILWITSASSRKPP